MNYIEKCNKLTELYRIASSTNQPFQSYYRLWIDIESPHSKTFNNVWRDMDNSPHINSDLSKWRVKPQETWKSKLFIGAPIMANTLVKNSDWEMFMYSGELNFYKFSEMHRLPTIKEAPKNVWLCPWDEKPEGFDEVRVMMRNKLNNTWDYEPQDTYESEDVTAIMILEDFQ